jgi:predicted RNase H-like HicB family nuclease
VKAYTVVLSPDPHLGGFSVSVPAMPGALSQGNSRDEALANIQEAMEGWIEAAAERGIPRLEETPELVARGIAEILEFRSEEGWDLLVETAVVTPKVAAAA